MGPCDADCVYPTKPPGFANAAVPPFITPDAPPDSVRQRWPLYSKARPLQVEISAGEILYPPIFWWHCVTGGVEQNFQVNWWCDVHPDKAAPGPEGEGARGALAQLKRSLEKM